jgi:hypothetical protein
MAAVDVALERAARGRPERSVVLVGLRGVGKTVLLNALRGRAIDRLWGTAKLEVRQGHSIRRPVASALHLAVRDIAARHRNRERVERFLGVLKAFALRSSPEDAKLRDRWQPGIDVPAASGRADTGDIEIDLLEILVDAADLARDVGTGIGLYLDEMQDLSLQDASALCAAFHEISQQGLPVVLVGAGLPHVPTTLSASKSYSERLFRYVAVGRLDRPAADRALVSPALEEGAEFTADALDALYATTDGYPYFVQAYGKVVWDVAPGPRITVEDVAVAAPMARADLGVGFFGSRYERATPAERDYLQAMATLATALPEGDGAVATSEVARVLGRKPASLSPARDALLKKGLVYSAERGSIAFTVPHFAAYLREHSH